MYSRDWHNIANTSAKILMHAVTKRKDTCIPMFIAALFTMAKTWKQSKCPLTDE